MTKESVTKAINKWDPLQAIYFNEDATVCNDDEYDDEVYFVCRCIAECGGDCSAEKLTEIMREVFCAKSCCECSRGDGCRQGFNRAVEEILSDTSTGGMDVSEVKPYTYNDARLNDSMAMREEEIMIRLFGEDTPANRERLEVLKTKQAKLNEEINLEFLTKIFGEPVKE